MSNIRQIIKKPQVKSLWNNKKEVATKPNKHREKRNGGVTRNNWLQSLKAILFLGNKRSLQSPDPTVAEARYRTEQTNQLQDFRSQKRTLLLPYFCTSLTPEAVSYTYITNFNLLSPPYSIQCITFFLYINHDKYDIKSPPLDQEQDFDRTYLQNPNCRTYITAHKTCNRKSSGNRERTIITSTSNNIIREGCETISNRCSDRKYKKRQNSTNKQIIDLSRRFFWNTNSPVLNSYSNR